ncbi:hypothetical protein [Streptomyces violaceusniger]|uniref:Uncharacterized protein n=1 Tax=Streptomyces violaceusniger (strain Tu 4113) TaxID=653045 RepID=G2PHR4_STRV4|nr:hypothetical protein [Streptomyces violaceusniger]AEM88865.1 hypothetical protein Strvi_0089 [Streptomyces violaceusniger Tu 4113]
MTDDRTYVLQRAKAAEARTRPVTAELTVKDGAAVLRLLDRDGNVGADRYRITLPGSVDYLSGPTLTLAGEFIAAAGFRLDGGWNDPTEWDTPDGQKARTAIDVTPEYLAYVGRKFGPMPSLGERPEGMSAHHNGWGSWQLCYQNRRFFDLKWAPRLTGPEWTLCSLMNGNGATEHQDPQEAMAAAVDRVAASDARRDARGQQ